MMTSTPVSAVNSKSQQNKEDEIIIDMLIKFAILMEYQLLELQGSVREFVKRMTESVAKLDSLVSEEGAHAQSLFESIFEGQERESAILNDRAKNRVDDIIAEMLQTDNAASFDPILLASTLGESTEGSEKASAGNSESAKDSLWSVIAKKLESVCRLEERLRPQVYSLIECLSFEDIQTQQLDHLLASYKLLNEELMQHLHSPGQTGDTSTKIANVLHRIRTMYTMESERSIFDNVFPPDQKASA